MTIAAFFVGILFGVLSCVAGFVIAAFIKEGSGE